MFDDVASTIHQSLVAGVVAWAQKYFITKVRLCKLNR